MTWEMFKGFFTVHIWIAFWVLFIFIAIVLYHQIRFKGAKAYLKSVGLAFVAVGKAIVMIAPTLWACVKTIFNPYEVK